MTEPQPHASRERLAVGLVRGVHGLKGALRVEILTDDPARFSPGAVVRPEGSDEPLTVEWARPDGPGLLVRFHEVQTRERADALREVYLEADADPGARTPGSFYWHEIIGLSVSAETGETLGHVADIFRVAESEVYVVRGGDRGEILVPAVRAIVRELAPEEGRIVVDQDALGLEQRAPAAPSSSPAAPQE